MSHSNTECTAADVFVRGDAVGRSLVSLAWLSSRKSHPKKERGSRLVGGSSYFFLLFCGAVQKGLSDVLRFCGAARLLWLLLRDTTL